MDLEADALDRHAPYGVVQGLVELLRLRVPREEGRAYPLAGFLALAGVPFRPSAPVPTSPPPPGDRLLGNRTDTLPRAEEVRAELLEVVTSRAAHHPLLVTLRDGEFVDAPSRTFFGEMARQLFHTPVALVISLGDEDRESHESWRRALGPGIVRWERLEGTAPGGMVRLRPAVDLLGPAARRFVATVAAAGPDASVRVVEGALGLSFANLREAAAPALESGLVVREGDRYLLTEPGLQSELQRLLPASELRTVHTSIARALRSAFPRPEGKMLYRLAEHWIESGVAEEAAPALLATGTESSRRGAHEDAELELRRALVLAQSLHGVEGRELEERILAALGISLEMQGNLGDAMATFERAIRACQERKGSVERWGPILSRMSRLVTESGKLTSDVDERLLRAIPEAEKRRLPVVEAELRASLAHRQLMRGLREEGEKQGLAAVALAEKGKDAAILARALRMAALGYGMGAAGGGDAEARALLQRLVETLTPETAGGEYAFALDDLATIECSEHREAKAVDFGMRSVELARKICARGDLLLMLGNCAEHQLHLPDAEGASRTLREIRTLADRYGLSESHAVRQQWSLIEGLRLRLVGDLPGARRQLESTFLLGEKVGARDIMGQALAYLVVLAVEAKEWEAARGHLRRLEREGLRKVLFSNYREILDAAVAKIPPKGG